MTYKKLPPELRKFTVWNHPKTVELSVIEADAIEGLSIYDCARKHHFASVTLRSYISKHPVLETMFISNGVVKRQNGNSKGKRKLC